MSKLSLASESIPNSKKSFSAFLKEFTVFKRPNLPTRIFANSPIPISIFRDNPRKTQDSAFLVHHNASPLSMTSIPYSQYPPTSYCTLLHLRSLHHSGPNLRPASKTSILGPPPHSFQSVQVWIHPNTHGQLTRLYSNQLDGLQSHIGSAIFSTDIDDDLLPSTKLSFMIDFL